MQVSRSVVSQTVDEVSQNWLAGQELYSSKQKTFFIDRYIALLECFPSLESADTILELGLAGGVLAILLNKLYQPNKMLAIEHPQAASLYSPSFLQLLKKAQIQLHKADLNQLPLFDKTMSFDLISLCDVIEHLVPASLPPLLSTLHELLAENGLLVINTPNVASLLKRLNLLGGKNPVELDLQLHEGATYGHIREYTAAELKLILKTAGFEIVNGQFFQLDTKRNIFTRLEGLMARLVPSLANSICLVAKKQYSEGMS